MPGAFFGGQKRVPRIRPAWTRRSVETGTKICEPGALSPPGPRSRFLPASGGFHVEAFFLPGSRFRAKGPPVRRKEGGAFSPGISGGATRLPFASSVAFFSQRRSGSPPSPWINFPSPAPPVGFCRALSPACRAASLPAWLFGARPLGAPGADRRRFSGLVLRFGVLSEPSLPRVGLNPPPVPGLGLPLAPRPSGAGGFRGGGSSSVRGGPFCRGGQSRSAPPVWRGPQDPRRPSRGGFPGWGVLGPGAFRWGPATVHNPFPPKVALASDPPSQGLFSGFRAPGPQRGWAARGVQKGLFWAQIPPTAPSATSFLDPGPPQCRRHVWTCTPPGWEKGRGKVFLSAFFHRTQKGLFEGRLILDLTRLKGFVRNHRFRMLTLAQVRLR
ncbi:hypothetical protein GWK47_042765 [Chionoecetes opilio]|uniref:Uncharacterized protein n=1 Tax=Chionoecetes opilio TaxID=41210 RepID=A0A8J4YB48_CHIOP|nr:hypothetical protein GWK47_042765 [Chionoecetes opilio]